MSKKTIISPKGIARYPWLNEPDTAFGQNNYKVDLILDPEDEGVSEFLTQLDELAEASYEKAMKEAKTPAAQKKLVKIEPYKEQEDDEGVPTGKVIVHFKQTASIEYEGRKIDLRPTLVDSQKRKVDPNEVRIGGGSVIRVGFEYVPYCFMNRDCGVSFRVRAVQILELVEPELGFGFEAEQDGFEAAPILGEGADVADF